MTDIRRQTSTIFPGALLPFAFLFALWSLLVPVIGPVMDIHFAARDPYHGHVTLTGPLVPHVHTYRDPETGQVRVNVAQKPPTTGRSGASSNDIIYIAVEHGGSPASVVSLVIAAVQSLAFPDVDGSWPTIPVRTLIHQAFSSPLLDPPKP